ncbi:hypothetical protein HY483_00255 [Candidatus Woesearchaeota archaeon]|nr:hypothetical protein [Candidatus Woesearchaeota archaeon]
MYSSQCSGYDCGSGSLYSGNSGYFLNNSGYSNQSPSYSGISSNYSKSMYDSQSAEFSPSFFVDESSEFVGVIPERDEIIGHAKTVFSSLTNQKFPDNISINLCDNENFSRLLPFGASENSCVMGFAVNRKGFGISKIFVRNNSLPQLFVTLGHEIGHVITRQLSNVKDEEAKAFSFARAWVVKTKELNIAGLDKFLKPRPALNGVHNVAFDFVEREIAEGISPLRIYVDVASGRKSVGNLDSIVFGG